MKKVAALIVGFVVAFAAIGTHFVARAGVTCSLPFQLQNSTTADATQVMANYNALITCLANAAAAGANNDITSLAALSTPITTAQGGTPVYVGGTSTGAGNAQALSTVSPTTFALTAGRQVTFIAGFSNTGATTLNVAATGAVNVFRQTQLGISALVGGEIVVGRSATVIYDGTQFQLVSVGPVTVGEIKDYAGSSAPTGWAIIDGSCQLRAGIFADLFSIAGTTYDPTGSTCDVAHFALPDGRGRVLAGKDTTLARITAAGSGCNGNTLGGAGCGTQAQTVNQANLPNVNFTVTDPGHAHAIAEANTFSSSINSFVSPASGSNLGNAAGAVITSTTGISVNSGGSGTGLATLPPLQIVTKIIKL